MVVKEYVLSMQYYCIKLESFEKVEFQSCHAGFLPRVLVYIFTTTTICALFLQKGMARQLVVSKTWRLSLHPSVIRRKKGLEQWTDFDGSGVRYLSVNPGVNIATAARKKYWYSRPFIM